MRKLVVRKIYAVGIAAADVVKRLDAEGVEYTALKCLNWDNEFPYLPDVQFRIAHTGSEIVLHYKVAEQSVRARYGNDNGAVWTDSCVEFFVRFAGEKIYYNIEASCIGTLLIGRGELRNNRAHEEDDVMAKVDRWSSLGRTPFEVREGECGWELALVLPREVFTQSPIEDFGGMQACANFYKCGDELPVAHFVSWNAIDAPAPNFHLPEFFGELTFEK